MPAAPAWQAQPANPAPPTLAAAYAKAPHSPWDQGPGGLSRNTASRAASASARRRTSASSAGRSTGASLQCRCQQRHGQAPAPPAPPAPSAPAPRPRSGPECPSARKARSETGAPNPAAVAPKPGNVPAQSPPPHPDREPDHPWNAGPEPPHPRAPCFGQHPVFQHTVIGQAHRHKQNIPLARVKPGHEIGQKAQLRRPHPPIQRQPAFGENRLRHTLRPPPSAHSAPAPDDRAHCATRAG